MKYWKVKYYVAEGDFEIKSFYITDEQHEKIKEAMRNGAEYLATEGKPTFKTSLLAVIEGADFELNEIQKAGTKIDGILDVPNLPKLSGEVMKPKTAEQIIKDTHFDLYKKHGWAHGDACVCKSW